MQRSTRFAQWLLAVLNLALNLLLVMFFYVANRVLIASVFAVFAPKPSGQMVRLQAFVLLLLPVLLVLPEWWLLDALRRRVLRLFGRRGRNTGHL